MERRLAAILAGDVAGYSRLVEADEEAVLSRLRVQLREVVEPQVTSHRGRVFKTMGDGFLAEFASVVDAARCASALQAALTAHEAGIESARRLAWRLGLNLGDVVVEGGDVHGDGVNVAARLEALAEPGTVCVSATAHEHLRGKLELAFEDLGEQALKNIARPVRVYRLAARATAEPARPALTLPDKPSLVVLPFQNMSGDAEQEYFADGMTEEITTALSRIRQFFVIARNTAFTYKGKKLDLKQVGRELGVRYLLEGSVRKSGTRVRITGQLIEAATGTHLWADKFDGALENVFDLQDRITESVVGAVEPSITKAEIERARRKPPENLQAHDLVLRSMGDGRNYGTNSLRAALSMLRKAIVLDPGHALAHAIAARYISSLRARDALENKNAETNEAIDYMLRAIELEPDDPTVLGYAAMARPWLDRGISTAVAWLDRAIALNPNSVIAYGLGAHVRNWAGDYETAVDHAQRAMRLSPFDDRLHTFQYATGISYLLRRRPERAVEWMRKSIQSDPGFPGSCFALACALAHCGEIAEARIEMARMLTLQPNISLSWQRRTRVFQVEADWEYALAGARIAGLPD